MKLNFFSLLALATSVSAHATWQELWVDGVDQEGTCVRLPTSNSPVGTLDDTVRCGTGSVVTSTCSVEAGGSVTIEMHQQPGDRTCTTEAIGGNHDGPVIAYLSKVDDATSDPGSSWFKIYQNGLVSTDYWGTDVLNDNCGKQNITIPSDIEPGDYLLRSEVIALHVAGSEGGAQHYVSCYQLKITGGGSASPEGVEFPGAYALDDPGILFNLYGSYTTYTVPGPTVYGAGAGSGSATAASVATSAAAIVSTSAAAETTSSTAAASTSAAAAATTSSSSAAAVASTSTSAAAAATTSSSSAAAVASTSAAAAISTSTSAAAPVVTASSSAAGGPKTTTTYMTSTTYMTTTATAGASASSSASSSSAAVGTQSKYEQCGGTNWTGGDCASGLTCTYQNDYYSQCL